MTDSNQPAIELRAITKSFGGLLANDAIDLELWPAEVHGILGENGAGKTTLMRVLYGLSSIDAGEIRVAGRPVPISSPSDAIAAGIGWPRTLNTRPSVAGPTGTLIAAPVSTAFAP